MCSCLDLSIADSVVGEAEVDKELFSKLTSLGKIVVKWYQGKVVPKNNSRSAVPSPSIGASLADGKVPEKNLKGQAITHQTA